MPSIIINCKHVNTAFRSLTFWHVYSKLLFFSEFYSCWHFNFMKSFERVFLREPDWASLLGQMPRSVNIIGVPGAAVLDMFSVGSSEVSQGPEHIWNYCEDAVPTHIPVSAVLPCKYMLGDLKECEVMLEWDLGVSYKYIG